MGTFHLGRFYLRACLEGEPDETELAILEEYFAALSNELHDATDGQHALGAVLISTSGFGLASADLWIKGGSAAFTGEARLWLNQGAVELGYDTLGNVTLGAHELAHYLYDVRDEYAGPGAAPDQDVTGLACCSDTAEACLMDNRNGGGASGWYYLADPAPIADWNTLKTYYANANLNQTYLSFQRGQPSEFCHPAPADPNLQHDTTVGNYQNAVHGGAACWETLVDPGAGGEKDYGLVLPANGPVTAAPVPPAAPVVELLIATQRFVLVLDRSGSMSGVKLQQLAVGAKFWIDYVTAPEELGLVSFSSTPNVDLPLAEVPADAALEVDFRDDGKALVDALVAGGDTAIGDALRLGLQEITKGGLAADQVLVLVTDGLQNAGAETAADVVPDLLAAGVRVVTLGVGADQDAALLESIATATGGEYLPIPAGDAADDQAQAIADLLIELAGSLRKDGAVVCRTELALASPHGAAPGVVFEPPSSALQEPPAATVDVLVTQGSRRCSVGAAWFGAPRDFRVELLDPLGRAIGPSSTTRLHGGSEPYAFVVVDDPLPGTWRLRVVGRIRAASRVRVFGFEERPGLRLSMECDPRLPVPGRLLRIVARLHAPVPVPGAVARAHLCDASGWQHEVELGAVVLRDSVHAPPDAYQGEIFVPSSARGPLTVTVELRHRGGRERVELDGRALSSRPFDVERVVAGVEVPACVRRQRVVLRLASGSEGRPRFRRGHNTLRPWLPSDQARSVRLWNERHRR